MIHIVNNVEASLPKLGKNPEIGALIYLHGPSIGVYTGSPRMSRVVQIS